MDEYDNITIANDAISFLRTEQASRLKALQISNAENIRLKNIISQLELKLEVAYGQIEEYWS